MSAITEHAETEAVATECADCGEQSVRNGACTQCGYFAIENEGVVKYLCRTQRRVRCNCKNVATKRHTYLLEGGRRNPRSSAYGRDDCSWASDHAEFTCDKCPRPRVDGYDTCSTFSLTPDSQRFAHMFLEAKDVELGAETGAAPDLLHGIKCALEQLEMAHNEAFGEGCDGKCSYHEGMKIARAAIAKAAGAA